MGAYQPGKGEEAEEEDGFKAQVGPLGVIDVVELQNRLAVQHHIVRPLKLVAHLCVPGVADEVYVLVPEPVPAQGQI